MPDGGKAVREPGWLLLIHQIPPKPNYFRVKIWRRLQRLDGSRPVGLFDYRRGGW